MRKYNDNSSNFKEWTSNKIFERIKEVCDLIDESEKTSFHDYHFRYALSGELKRRIKREQNKSARAKTRRG